MDNIVSFIFQLLEPHIGSLCALLPSAATSPMVLQMFVDMAAANPHPFVIHVTQLKHTAEQQTALLHLVAKVIGAAGKTSQVSRNTALPGGQGYRYCRQN